MVELLIGADPEFFVYKDGKPVSAHGLIEGTKKNPLPVKDGAVQVDGMALEFNINPVNNANDFEKNIASVLADLRDMVPKEYEFSFTPVAEFGKEYIAEQPEEARRLGCDPDFNAWTHLPNPMPPADGSFRTASGHIHLGWTENQDINDPEHIEACEWMVKQLDVYLGTASVLWDRDNRRRQLYGAAGAYRPKSYGVEYRVMSNVWLTQSWMREHVFTGAKKAFDRLMNGQKNYPNDYDSHLLTNTINEGKWRDAWGYVGYYNNHHNLSELRDDLEREEIRIAEAKRQALKANKVKNTPDPRKFSEAVAEAQMKRRRKPVGLAGGQHDHPINIQPGAVIWNDWDRDLRPVAPLDINQWIVDELDQRRA